ncbi:MAG: ABC transporter ATP-binding protein [Alphaproteobacteria bacterium]
MAVFFMAVAAAMTAAIAALMQPILDDVLNEGKEEFIIPVAVGLSVAFAARGITTYIHTILMNKTGQSIVADIQRQLFSHSLGMDMAFFHANPSGQMISRVVNDVSVMRAAVTDTLTGFGKSFFTLIFLIGVMFYRDWFLTLSAFIVFPLLTVFVIYIGKRLRKVSNNIQSEMGGLSDLLSQSFQGVRLIKAYGMEQHEARKIGVAIDKVRDLNIKSVKLGTLSTPVNEFIVGLIFAGIIIYGGYGVIEGHTSAGELGSFLAAFIMAYEPMKKLAKLNNSLQVGLGASDRVFSILDDRPQIVNKVDAKSVKIDTPSLHFKDVCFSYEGEDVSALNNISFDIMAGKVTALVGASGGGKSTIMNLIPRFYDVGDGAIKIDDYDIRDVTMTSLRAHIALVSQDITIFNETIMDNIRYGREGASDDEVIAVAKMAAAHEFIEGFDDRYDTIVGEDGTRLSGGQRQRISIARAMLRDAPILLLDEATSALDNESEKLVQEALQKLEKGRTTLVIAHRLSTVQKADLIIVLDQGAIVERGTHDELMVLDGVYAGMYKTGMKD